MFANGLRPSFVCFLVLGVLLSGAGNVEGQVLYGSIVGTVTDQTGAMVPRASAAVTSKATGLSKETTTDEAGRYSLTNILPGIYDLRIAAAGFKPFTQTNLIVTINTVTRADVKLEVGQVVETVTVEASIAILQTDTAEVKVELGERAVTDLPLPRYRNYQSLIDLVPGATPGRFQNAIMDTPARALSTNVNGTNRNNNNTRVDGATNIYVWLPHHSLYVAPAETIQTVNVVTNSFDAEQGMAGGAAINVNTKSGSNEFHGSVFALHENQKLRARQFFLPTTERKPRSTVNVDGFSFGGPIRRNRIFFFGGWEGNRERVGRTGLFSVPTPEMRRGDFSATGTTIYDPLTGDAEGRGRTPFPGNVLPAGRQSSIIRKLVELNPLPNQPGAFANYFRADTQRMDRDNFDFKINWARNDKHMIWGKYSAMDAQVQCNFSLGAAGGPALCDGGAGLGSTLVQLSTIGHSWTFTPNFIVDGTLGWSRMGQEVRGPDFGQNFGLDVLGIPGTNGPDIRQSGMPRFDIAGYTSLGNPESWTPLFRNDQSFTFTQNVGWIRGAHDLRFGFDAVHHLLNHWNPHLAANPRGFFNFSGGGAALNGGPSPNRFHAYAQFMLGDVTSLGKAVQFIKLNGQEWQFAGYVRDRWRATPKLTVSLGLRYEYYPLITRAQGGIERYDAETNQVFLGGFGNVPKNAGVTTSKKLFAPRVGIAYRFTDSTVVRTGYGITYNPMPMVRPLQGFFPHTIASDFPGPNPFTAFAPIARGIPEICCPEVSRGVVPLPLPALMRTPFQGLLKRGYIQSWNFIVERRLPAEFVASVGYVGTQTVRSFADLDLNTAPPGGGRTGQPYFARYGRVTSTLLLQGWLNANYHSLQTTLNRQFRGGLYAKGAYTFSRAINWTDDDGWAGVTWNHSSVWRRNRAQAGYNVPHIFQMAFVYELPMGKGKKWASSGRAAQAILGGWQVNGHLSSFQGRPFTVTASGASLNSPGNGQTADQVKPKVKKLGGIGRGNPFFDTEAFRPVTEVRFGTSGRNLLRGPGVANLDAGIFRTFLLTEAMKLEFRAEAFNASNTPHFNNPAANASDPASFMRITSTDVNAPERQFRFGLRLTF